MWKTGLLVLVLFGCAGAQPPPAQAPPDDTEVKVTPPSPSASPKTIATAAAPIDPQASPSKPTPKTIACTGKMRPHARFEQLEGPSARPSNLLGLWAPTEPPRPATKSHVRREAAVSKNAPDLAKAIDGAAFDTSPCRALTTTTSEPTVEIDVTSGVVKSVTRLGEGDDLLACAMTSFCELPSLGKASGQASVTLHLRPMSERPRVKPSHGGTADEAQKAMIEVVSEAAAACEQGQALGSKPTTAVVTVGASLHSSVAPTMSIDFQSASGMKTCMTVRIEGFRLSLPTWTPVSSIDLDVTWDG